MKNIQQRFVLSFLGFIGVINSHLMRVSLSVEIITMTEPPVRPLFSGVEFTEKFTWSQRTQGIILASFYIGYVLIHVPGCYLVQKFGGKIVLNGGLFIAALCTLATPFIVSFGGSIGIILVRVIIGLCQGTTFPALSRILSEWIPKNERGILSALVFAGGHIGAIFALLLSGEVIQNTQGYGTTFFIIGTIGIVWNILFYFFAFNRPENHPRISDIEKKYLQRKIGVIKASKTFSNIPWSSIVTSGPVWALTIAKIGHDWVFYCLTTYMPKYLFDVLNLPINIVTRYCTIPYFLLWIVSLASAALGDYLVSHKKLTVTQSRKMFTTIAAAIPCIAIIGVSYSEKHTIIVVLCFVIAMGGLGFFFAGAKVNILDLCPRHCAPLMTIVNGIGACCGVVSPILTGSLTTHATMEEWRLVFWISSLILLISAIVYAVLGSGEVQSWNYDDATSSVPTISPESPITISSSYNSSQTHLSNENSIKILKQSSRG